MLAKSCSKQGLFAHSNNRIDCDYCPGEVSCVIFWDTYVVNLPDTEIEKERYLPAVSRVLGECKGGVNARENPATGKSQAKQRKNKDGRAAHSTRH